MSVRRGTGPELQCNNVYFFSVRLDEINQIIVLKHLEFICGLQEHKIHFTLVTGLNICCSQHLNMRNLCFFPQICSMQLSWILYSMFSVCLLPVKFLVTMRKWKFNLNTFQYPCISCAVLLGTEILMQIWASQFVRALIILPMCLCDPFLNA